MAHTTFIIYKTDIPPLPIKMIKCYQCKMKFMETSVQSNKRRRNNTPPICRDCNRLNNALRKMTKRNEFVEKEFLTEEDIMIRKVIELKKKYGTVSNPLVQRNLKIDYDKAAKIIEKVNGND